MANRIMEKRDRKKKKALQYPAGPRKPSPSKREESADSLYYIAIVAVVGISLCLIMGAFDYVSQNTTPIADTTETIEYFE